MIYRGRRVLAALIAVPVAVAGTPKPTFRPRPGPILRLPSVVGVVQIVVMGHGAVLEVTLEEEQQEKQQETQTVEILPMTLEEEEEVEITAPGEVVVSMEAAVGPKTLGMPVVQIMGVPVEHPGEGRAGCRLTAERVMLRAAAEVVPLSIQMAPLPQGRWVLQGTMVTAPEIKTAVLLQILDRVTVGTVTLIRL